MGGKPRAPSSISARSRWEAGCEIHGDYWRTCTYDGFAVSDNYVGSGLELLKPPVVSFPQGIM